MALSKLFITQGLSAFYRYFHSSLSNHFYTTNIIEIGTSFPGLVGRHGYVSEGVACLIYTTQVGGSVPLYRYFNGRDHFYTTNANEIATTTPGEVGNHGYTSEGIAGYCFPHARQGTVPLYRYYSGSGVDHFYTTNIAEIGTAVPGQAGLHGYTSEGVACYVIAFFQ